MAYTNCVACTVTRSELFADYLREQLKLLMSDYDVRVEVDRSCQEIPFPYVLEACTELGELGPIELARYSHISIQRTGCQWPSPAGNPDDRQGQADRSTDLSPLFGGLASIEDLWLALSSA